LVLLVDHSQRVPEHGLPLAQQVERRHPLCRPASAAAGTSPFSTRAPWSATSPTFGARSTFQYQI
jgi:hypothetical protein